MFDSFFNYVTNFSMLTFVSKRFRLMCLFHFKLNLNYQLKLCFDQDIEALNILLERNVDKEMLFCYSIRYNLEEVINLLIDQVKIRRLHILSSENDYTKYRLLQKYISVKNIISFPLEAYESNFEILLTKEITIDIVLYFFYVNKISKAKLLLLKLNNELYTDILIKKQYSKISQLESQDEKTKIENYLYLSKDRKEFNTSGLNKLKLLMKHDKRFILLTFLDMKTVCRIFEYFSLKSFQKIIDTTKGDFLKFNEVLIKILFEDSRCGYLIAILPILSTEEIYTLQKQLSTKKKIMKLIKGYDPYCYSRIKSELL